MTVARENKGTRASGAPSSQGNKAPVVLRKPVTSRSQEPSGMSAKENWSGGK
jgi:hypothetical protein